MRVTLLIFVLFLSSAGTTRQFILPSDVLPEDYLGRDEEKEYDAEQTPEISATTSVLHLDQEQDLLKKSLKNLQEHSKLLSAVNEEEKISEEAEALESRFGPRYHDTLTKNYSEEQHVDVSDNAGLLQMNITEETIQEDFKINVMLAVSSTAFTIYLIFLICLCIVFAKSRMQKGNFCPAFSFPCKRQRSASEAWSGTEVGDDSRKKGSNSETLSLDIPPTADAPNPNRTSEALNEN